MTVRNVGVLVYLGTADRRAWATMLLGSAAAVAGLALAAAVLCGGRRD